MLPVAVLAGGLATRLRPVTEKVPKALLPVAGRPFIHWQLELLARQGITQAVLCVGFLGEQIQSAVGDGTGSSVAVRYSFDGDVPLGTGGALKRALPMLGTAFFVLYGDSYLPCSFAAAQAAYEASGAPGLMTVFCNENRWETSNVLFREGRIIEYNKRAPRPGMAHVDYGLGILSARALEKYSTCAAFDLADFYHELALRGELAGLEVSKRFYEIGSVRGIEATEHYLTTEAQKMSYARRHLQETAEIIHKLDTTAIEKVASLLGQIKADGGRLFFLGVGGSAANCSHAVNDFRNIVGIECYAPTDNVSELTARTNDEGWASVFVEWLKVSRLSANDALFIMSVGGGNLERNISSNLVWAIQLAKKVGAKVTGIVGRDGGYTAQVADACIIVPTVNVETITPHTEAFQAVIWHLLVSHPLLKAKETKWELAVK